MNMAENDSKRADLEEKVKNLLENKYTQLNEENYTIYYNSAYKQINDQLDVEKMPEYDKILAIVALVAYNMSLASKRAYEEIYSRYQAKGDTSGLKSCVD